ncbi:MAG: hypothetical protein Q4A60_06415 [Pasteurellaceae bacterium]|nr:hypothetical protein [Pasteurellaceae bacterium]
MAYQTGIAQNERDLLDKLNKFLTKDPVLVENGQAWTVLYDQTFPATLTEVERRKIMWKSTGTGTEQHIYVGCETVNSIAQDTYNLNFYGGTYFNPELVQGEQMLDGIINRCPGVALFADARPIEYHFIADGRCCKVITRISNVCSSAYFGFILPTVPPTEYPYPLCIAGSAPVYYRESSSFSYKTVLVRYSNTTRETSSIVDPRCANCWLFTPDQSWRDFYGSSYVNNTNDSNYQWLYPLCNYQFYSSGYHKFLLDTQGPSLDGYYPLLPVEFLSTRRSSQGKNRWGAMDGVYHISGIQRAAGDQITLTDGQRGIVFSGGHRSGTSDFFVVLI